MAATPARSEFHHFADLYDSANRNPVECGVIVPQTVPRAAALCAAPKPDIIFPECVSVPAALALPSTEKAMRGLRAGYKRTVDVAAVFGGDTIQLHLEMPGFAPWRTGVHVCEVHDARTLPVATLVRRVARAVNNWHEEHKHVPCTNQTFGNVALVPLEQIVLIELRHVDEDVWQPVLGWRFQPGNA